MNATTKRLREVVEAAFATVAEGCAKAYYAEHVGASLTHESQRLLAGRWSEIETALDDLIAYAYVGGRRDALTVVGAAEDAICSPRCSERASEQRCEIHAMLTEAEAECAKWEGR